MAKADKDFLAFRANTKFTERIDSWADERGMSRSEALRKLVDTGLRERQSPLLYRAKDLVVEIAALLAVFAVVFLAGGVVTASIPAYRGYLMALVLAAMAVIVLGALELARVASGQSDIGQHVREVIGR